MCLENTMVWYFTQGIETGKIHEESQASYESLHESHIYKLQENAVPESTITFVMNSRTQLPKYRANIHRQLTLFLNQLFASKLSAA